MTTDKQKYFKFLDDLRQAGTTNMFGAGIYLVQEYGITNAEAKDIVLDWMKSYETTEPTPSTYS
jgi:hypothetical protein